jgi:hypothetical protein
MRALSAAAQRLFSSALLSPTPQGKKNTLFLFYKKSGAMSAEFEKEEEERDIDSLFSSLLFSIVRFLRASHLSLSFISFSVLL